MLLLNGFAKTVGRFDKYASIGNKYYERESYWIISWKWGVIGAFLFGKNFLLEHI